MRIIDARAVRPASLARIFIHVDPAFVVRAAQKFSVVLTQRRKPFDDFFIRLVVRQRNIRFFHERDIDIVHMLSLGAENFAAEGDISVQNGQRRVHGRNQVFIYRRRNVLPRKCHGKTAFIPARVLIKYVLFDIAGIGGSDDVDERTIGAVIRLETGFTRLPRSAAHHQPVSGVRDLRLFAVQFADGQRQVGIVEHGKHLAEPAERFTRQSHDFFLFLG